MTTRYSTALSHIILAGTSFYCYLGAKQISFSYPKCSFGIIIANSLIGVWRWGNPDYGQASDLLYRFTLLLQDYLVLPCLVSTVWLQYSYPSEIATAYTLLSFLPIINNLNDNETSKTILDTIIGVNCLTLFVLSVMYQNYYGVAACLSHTFNHFIVKEDNGTYFNVTSQDLYNYAMCFFAYFSLRTVLD